MDEVSFASLDMKKFYTFTAVGLVGTRILLYLPMSIKTRLQVEQEQSVRALIRRHGVRQLYKGVGTVAFGIVPTQWLYLTALEVSKEKARFDGVLGFPVVERMMSNAFAGGVSSCASAVVGVPLDVVSQRMQLGEGSFSKVVSNVYRARGLRGFFQGYVASLIVYAPTSACWWMTYSNTRAILSEFSNGASNGAVGIGLSGAIAGCTSAFCTNPLDVLKTRKQTATTGNPSLLYLAQDLFKNEGAKGFLRGAPARAIAMSTNSLLMILSYEYVKKIARKADQ